MLLDSLDAHSAQLLALTTHLQYFTWSNYSLGLQRAAPRTVAQLRRLEHLRALSLLHHADPRTFDPSPALCRELEYLAVDMGTSVPWCALPFLQHGSVRTLDLKNAAEVQDDVWMHALCAAAAACRRLETLVVGCGSQTGAQLMITVMRHCIVRVIQCTCFEGLFSCVF